MSNHVKDEIVKSLRNLTKKQLREGGRELFATLGYGSERTLQIESVEEFIGDSNEKITPNQRTLFEKWSKAEILFQFSDHEITHHSKLFQTKFDAGRIKSFVFAAAELKTGSYTRTILSDMTRAVNRVYPMPVIILYRYRNHLSDTVLTIASVSRRADKRDDGLDVLEGVTLIKDISPENPHRAHIDILADLTLLREDSYAVDLQLDSFDKLQQAWMSTLKIEKLNKRFYRELFAWFEYAVKKCRFPDDGAGNWSLERHIIRLITRCILVWFLKEKGLIPSDIFKWEFARTTLKNHKLDCSDYYRAILQNLFFATLNTEIGKRIFEYDNDSVKDNTSRYRYHSLLKDPDAFINKLKQVPFINGGLFDCLDNYELQDKYRYIDVFNDDFSIWDELNVPTNIFFDETKGLFPLFERYKFTVEENTPLDVEVALDPELLGRTFENLLATYNPETRETVRKRTGSYYTPRVIVDYMVKEALVEALVCKSNPTDGDMSFWRERLLYLLDHQSAMEDAYKLFDSSEKKSIIENIASLKIIDPAVGSGAFPMGILQILTMALRRLDPQNYLWEQEQKNRTADIFERVNDSKHLTKISNISAIFDKYRTSDYVRKLYLIQNCIFGVDIQPIACQISRLRFFISLAIEQNPDASKPNYGIEPLPNLETRFIAADILKCIFSEKQKQLSSEKVKELTLQLRDNREKHFRATSTMNKRLCRDNDRILRKDLGLELSLIGMPDYNIDFITKWNPYDSNAIAEWFDSEYMFGEKSGFNIVIGNPPYIQLQKNRGRLGKLYKPFGYETFASTGDIYQLFFECGCGLLSDSSSILCYITSNSWLKAEYGKKLRKWLISNFKPLRLIEMGKDVFEEATVDTTILVIRNGGKDTKRTEFPAVDMDNLQFSSFPPTSNQWIIAQAEEQLPWVLLSPIEKSVLKKMTSTGTPLKDWDIWIYHENLQ
ncbi:MAG: Eco57I restriction-modification methylase domain-containing protein [Gammaproteobacteria bacterium]|nr:Eco57I restriction-modification methylase domain-containing protein [Gammaproteobacteria bacterium]